MQKYDFQSQNCKDRKFTVTAWIVILFSPGLTSSSLFHLAIWLHTVLQSFRWTKSSSWRPFIKSYNESKLSNSVNKGKRNVIKKVGWYILLNIYFKYKGCHSHSSLKSTWYVVHSSQFSVLSTRQSNFSSENNWFSCFCTSCSSHTQSCYTSLIYYILFCLSWHVW